MMGEVKCSGVGQVLANKGPEDQIETTKGDSPQKKMFVVSLPLGLPTSTKVTPVKVRP